jgi:hypothetical protein
MIEKNNRNIIEGSVPTVDLPQSQPRFDARQGAMICKFPEQNNELLQCHGLR